MANHGKSSCNWWIYHNLSKQLNLKSRCHHLPRHCLQPDDSPISFQGIRDLHQAPFSAKVRCLKAASIETFWKLSKVDNGILCFQKLFRIARHDHLPQKNAQNCWNDPSWPEKTAQDCSTCHKKWASNCLKEWCACIYRAKVVIAWHCCCRCLSLHGLEVSVNCRGHACCHLQNSQSSISTDRDHLSLDWLP